MKIEFDPKKDEENIRKHGVFLDLARGLDESLALIVIDDRKDYGETRYRALVPLSVRLHAIVYTRRQDGIRVISLRKANERERKLYEEEE
jgi:uncharacterized DUF497 family protein